MEGLGWEPYASDHEDGTAQFELNWKYADALTTADRYTFFKMMTSQVAQRYGAIATHMPKPFSRPDRQRRRTSTSRSGIGTAQNAFLGRRRPARPRPVAARLPLPRRAAGPRAGADRADRADRELLQAAVDRGVPDRRPVRLHVDAGVHHVRRQQPDPDVPDARAGAVRVPGRVGRGEPVPRAWPGSSPRASTASSAKLDPGEPMIGRNMYETPLEEARARGHPAHPAVAWPRRSTSSRRDEVVQSARSGPELAARVHRRSSARSGCATTTRSASGRSTST